MECLNLQDNQKMKQETIEKIKKIEEIYKRFLKVAEIKESCAKEFHEFFKLEEKDYYTKYDNPFMLGWDFDKQIEEGRNATLNFLIKIFNKEYPNIQIVEKDLEDFIEKEYNKEYSREEKTNIINFDKVISYFAVLESKKEDKAMEYLIANALKLIPYNIRHEGYDKPRIFKAEELVRNNKLVLHYYSEHSEDIRCMLKLISFVLEKQSPEIANEYECHRKFYKNYRLDIELKNKNDAMLVAIFLEAKQNNTK